MPAIRITDLPAPPAGREGWPWTIGTEPLPPLMPDGRAWPRITIVTPSYNQGRYIEETIRSVLLQGYPELEYIILDGGSKDDTVSILQRYAPFITHWRSTKDRGQADAVNQGLALSTGEWVGWQNSDDYYESGALQQVAQNALKADTAPDVYYGQVRLVEADSKHTGEYPTGPFDLSRMLPWANMFNQSMFFSRRVIEEGWRIDESLCHYVDHDLFWRLILAGKKFEHLPEVSASFRLHGEAKGSTQHEIAAHELHALYMRLFHEPKLPAAIRALALSSMRGNCLDQFGKSRWALFRAFAADIAQQAGWRGLGIGLMGRRLAVKLGAGNIDRARRLTRLFKGRANAA